MKVFLILLIFIVFTGIISVLPPSYASNVQVSITDGSGNNQNCVVLGNCFSPSAVQVNVGDTVTWTNQDIPAHIIVSDTTYGQQTGTLFQSGMINQYGSYSFTFQNPGTYPYHDQLHDWMKGTIIVGTSSATGLQTSIPNWIKTDALWWGQGQISDAEFIKALQWLINQGILSVPTNQNPTLSNPATATPSASTNSLSPIMPTKQDLGSFWKILGTTPSSQFSILQQALPPIIPTSTLEETLQKTTSTPPTVMTIDVASFQLNNANTQPEFAKAKQAYDYMNTDYKNNHSNYSQDVFNPTIYDRNIACYEYSVSKTESTDIDLFCLKGYTVFKIDINGNDINMNDDLKMVANLMLPRIFDIS